MKSLWLFCFLLVPLVTAQPSGNPAYAPVADVAGLPRVLLLGDSISVGYTLPVRAALQGIANVHRPAENCSSTGYALDRLDIWLESEKWAVIHFNFGLHDAKMPPEGLRHALPDTYEKNLREIVRRLKRSGATLIWATTTPVPQGGILAPDRRWGDIVAYNAAASKVMRENNVSIIDDLHAAALPYLENLLQPGDIHFTGRGSEVLAGHVAASIERALSAER